MNAPAVNIVALQYAIEKYKLRKFTKLFTDFDVCVAVVVVVRLIHNDCRRRHRLVANIHIHNFHFSKSPVTTTQKKGGRDLKT